MNVLLAMAMGGFNIPIDGRWALAAGLAAAVVVVAVLVVAAAAGIPLVGVAALTASLKTIVVGVASVALAVGVTAGALAGMAKDGRNSPLPDGPVVSVADRVDLHFEAAPEDPKIAADFRCFLVLHDASDRATDPPLAVREDTADAFYGHLERALDQWSSRTGPGGTAAGLREVRVYMRPFPGEGVYDRIRELCERRGLTVHRIEGERASSAKSR